MHYRGSALYTEILLVRLGRRYVFAAHILADTFGRPGFYNLAFVDVPTRPPTVAHAVRKASRLLNQMKCEFSSGTPEGILRDASFEVASFEAASVEVAAFEASSFGVASFRVASFEAAWRLIFRGCLLRSCLRQNFTFKMPPSGTLFHGVWKPERQEHHIQFLSLTSPRGRFHRGRISSRFGSSRLPSRSSCESMQRTFRGLSLVSIGRLGGAMCC